VADPAEIALGIDLGTTYSTAAAVIDGRMHFALDSRGEACVPSVVHFPRSGAPLIGIEADRMRSSDPQNTIFGIKRLIGRAADSPSARVLDQNAAFKIKPQANGEAGVQVRSGLYGASEVAALILRHLRERAEARFQRKITRAVLTVPVLATPAVRQAMVRCGKMAGLEVSRIVNEPAAGAVARGFAGPGWGTKPLLVYDFGGGTFDSTVIQRKGQQLEVLAAGGDDCLGGDDFDLTFARWVADVVYKSYAVEATKDVILWDRVQRQCESVKRALSSTIEARYFIREAFGSGQKAQHLDYMVKRSNLEPRWADLVARSIAACHDTVEASKLTTLDLGAVLLIGGTTYVPRVRSAVSQAFARPCAIEADPQTVVARGAALLAAQESLLVG
jgi:molecular chaperone DnaK